MNTLGIGKKAKNAYAEKEIITLLRRGKESWYHQWAFVVYRSHIPITVATQVNLLPKFWATCTLQSTQTQGVEELMVCLDNFCACPVCRVFNPLAPAHFQAENNKNRNMGQSKNWPARRLPQATKSECKLQSSITPAGRPGMLFSGCLTWQLAQMG